jgi:hypothetical protein
MGEMRNAYKFLVWKLEGKRPHWKPRCRWEDHIKMDHKEIGCKDVYWIDYLAQDGPSGSLI